MSLFKGTTEKKLITVAKEIALITSRIPLQKRFAEQYRIMGEQMLIELGIKKGEPLSNWELYNELGLRGYRNFKEQSIEKLGPSEYEELAQEYLGMYPIAMSVIPKLENRKGNLEVRKARLETKLGIATV